MALRKLTEKQIEHFQKIILDFHAKNRRTFPWRKKVGPYEILVSEIMLQQTQADRVVEKYLEFLKAFPTVEALAAAPVRDVLRMWQGLGYNRRALHLRSAAARIVSEYDGAFPRTEEELDALPGIGSYTAAAVMAFAFKKPVVMIETNIRSVYIEHFFKTKRDVADVELIPLIVQTLYRKNPRRWYSALMDYGSHLKKTTDNPSRRSKHHTKQSTFQGSSRQKRGQVLAFLLDKKSVTMNQIQKELGTTKKDTEALLLKMISDGLVIKKSHRYSIP